MPFLTTALQEELIVAINSIDKKVARIDGLAKDTMHFDYQIATEAEVTNIKNAKNEMRDLADLMVKVAAEYGITITKDDVKDGKESNDPS